MSNFNDINTLTKVLLESYNSIAKGVEDRFLSEDEYAEKMNELNATWKDSRCIEDRISPEEAFDEYFSEPKPFEEILYIYNSFASDALDIVPDFITEKVISYEEVTSYISSSMVGMNLSIDVDKLITKEELKEFYDFTAVLDLIAKMKNESLVEELMELLAKCPCDNESLIECIVCTVCEAGFIHKLIELVNNASYIDCKEHTILQFLARQMPSDEIYRCIKGSLKKESSSKTMTVEIASDYGDGRIIPILRKIAKQMLMDIYENGDAPYSKSEASQEFFLVCNSISRLGGSVEDLLAE